MGVHGQCHAQATLPTGKRPGTHCIGGWVESQGPSGRVRKISSPPGFDPRTVLPVALRLKYKIKYQHLVIFYVRYV